MAARDYVTEAGGLTIHWDSSLCYHAAECVKAQPGVFKRVALCRCGASENKPFCDGAHASVGFSEAGLTDSHPGA